MAKNDPKWPKRASSSIMECEVFILPDWSPPDNPIQSERASSSIMECEEFILPDWSPFDDPARVLETLVNHKCLDLRREEVVEHWWCQVGLCPRGDPRP